MYSNSSNAYELERYYDLEIPASGNSVKKKPTNKKVKKTAKKKAVKSKTKSNKKILNAFPVPVKVAVIAFLALSLICYRRVYIYGLHNSVEKVSAQLETVTMDNEQMTIAINSKIDSAKIAEYAQKHLGLQKIDDRQIIYLTGDSQDTMGKVAKNDEKPKHKGLFGVVAGITEYLR